MKEEIKELLENIKNSVNDERYAGLSLLDEDLKILLDYITNLQEENEMLNNECDTYMKIATKKQSRIDKAIEYIKPKFIEQGGLTSYEVNDLLNELLNILQGEEK